MGLMSLLFRDPPLFFVLAALLLYSVIAHEVAHGWVASLFGDDTARRYGRLTANPASHIDPLGTLMLLFVGFGWAKPVPVDYDRLKASRAGLIAVSLAGPCTNILIAIAAVFALQFPAVNGHPAGAALLTLLSRINIILGAFNLIPIPPLDGSKVILSFLPERLQRSFMQWERYGMLVLIILLFSGLLNPIVFIMQNAITSLISLLFHAAA